MNDNLRHAMAAARIQAIDLASALAVDPKTVHRWLKGRIPYPRHR
ncbi:helix-turn-helix domain-containing protein [Nonomuraea turcica]|nr:helix-turn-helix domain-containing protein [Nonomuraea sp. G32]MDP4507616.1 helix-turn-helix domain-containing protein [Nonomuraea sp. G32]